MVFIHSIYMHEKFVKHAWCTDLLRIGPQCTYVATLFGVFVCALYVLIIYRRQRFVRVHARRTVHNKNIKSRFKKRKNFENFLSINWLESIDWFNRLNQPINSSQLIWSNKTIKRRSTSYVHTRRIRFFSQNLLLEKSSSREIFFSRNLLLAKSSSREISSFHRSTLGVL